MGWLGSVRNSLFGLALAGFCAPPVEAVEIVNGRQPAGLMTDGLLTQVRAVVRHGGGVHRSGVHHAAAVHRPAVNRPVHRPVAPVHRPPATRPGYRPPVNRAVARPVVRPGPVVVAPRAVWVGRPGWYRWAPGGAVAAGAAIGFLTAAAVGSWAGAPPQQGLCWYYTDASQRQGFWDACP